MLQAWCLLPLILTAASQELTTPSALLPPRDFNHHAFDAKLFLQRLARPETTKQGPVLFPNDGPPPPRNPLIVTSRPLLESIARSELNSSEPQQSQTSSIIRPYLARVKDYRPYQFVLPTEAPQLFTPVSFTGAHERYDYERQTALPPIYKAISDHANNKLQKLRQQKDKNNYNYQVKEPDYTSHYKNKDSIGDEDYDQNKNYAFSYTVKDKKTGDDFSHTQQSRGSATNGEYRVRLPDGRMQIVSYTADENGYQADVRYDDEDKTSGNNIDNQYNDNNNHVNNHYKHNDNYNHVNDDYKHIDNVNHDNNYNDNNNRFDYDNLNDKRYDYSNDAKIDYKDYAQQRDYKAEEIKTPANDYYQDADLSKEYYNDDFSTEYESKLYDYAPHKSKYSAFADDKKDYKIAPKTNFASGSTVTPTYDELKDLLVTKKAYNTVPFYAKIPVELKVPSTTPTYDITTERVVHIGGKKPNLYTSITSSVPFVSAAPLSVTPSPIKFNSDFVSSSPRSYLVSTIASLRNKVDLSGPKPVLSNSYIDRINKYLSFN